MEYIKIDWLLLSLIKKRNNNKVILKNVKKK